MTNSEKIMMDSIRQGVYTAEEVKAFLSAGQMLPIHTAYEWRQLGFHVRKGEHARLKTKLWKMVPAAEDDLGNRTDPQFYLSDAFLFTSDQVERDVEAPDMPTDGTEAAS